MRDESKAAAVCLFVLILPVVLLAFLRPDVWNSVGRAVRASMSRHRQDKSLPPGRFDDFIARYGPPTFEEQGEKGSIRPDLFTKWLDYEPEHLRVAFVAPEPVEKSRPRTWMLIAFLDSTRPGPISPREAGQRLMSRQKR